MRQLASRMLLVFTAFLLIGGCAALKKDYDETADWSAQKIFEEGKKELADKHYEDAIKYFEPTAPMPPRRNWKRPTPITNTRNRNRPSPLPTASSACTPLTRTWTTPGI